MPLTRHSRFRALAISAAVAVGVAGPVVLSNPATATGSSVIDGPDVSSYQHGTTAPNWSKVAGAGKEFAIVKATEGTTYTNPYFSGDYTGARKAGLVRGSYHFARPTTPVISSAQAQAKHYAAALGTSTTTTRTLPPVLDIEVTGGLSRPALVAWAQAFLLETQRLTHRRPLIYTYPSFWTYSMGDAPALSRFPKWFASYGVSSAPSGSKLWQYTSTGSVNGISGNVDLNRFTGDATAWAAISDGTDGDPWPAAAPGAPQNVSASVSGGAVNVAWLPGDSGSTDIDHYRLVATSELGTVSTRVGPLAFAGSLTGLSPGQQYDVSVQAVNAVGAGTSSAPIAVTTSVVPTALRATAPAPVAFGQPATTELRLARSDTGAGLSGQQISVQRRRAGTTAWHDWSTVTTDSDGSAAMTLPMPLRDVQLRFAFAARGYRASSATTTVLVRSAVSAVLSASRVPAGRTVWLTGVVAPKAAGLVVRRQVLTSNGWLTVERTKTFEDGSYRMSFTPKVAHTVQMRTRVAPYDGREAGISPTVSLTVK